MLIKRLIVPLSGVAEQLFYMENKVNMLYNELTNISGGMYG